MRPSTVLKGKFKRRVNQSHCVARSVSDARRLFEWKACGAQCACAACRSPIPSRFLFPRFHSLADLSFTLSLSLSLSLSLYLSPSCSPFCFLNRLTGFHNTLRTFRQLCREGIYEDLETGNRGGLTLLQTAILERAPFEYIVELVSNKDGFPIMADIRETKQLLPSISIEFIEKWMTCLFWC